MDKPRLIKSIVPYVCPNCSHSIQICFAFMPPGLSWVITAEEMESNKRRLKESLKMVNFKSPEEKKKTTLWIDSDDCVLGAEDIEDILKGIIAEQKD